MLGIRVVTGVNGQSVANQHYCLYLPDGQKVLGVTDQDGLIEPVISSKPGQFTLRWLTKAEASDMAKLDTSAVDSPNLFEC